MDKSESDYSRTKLKQRFLDKLANNRSVDKQVKSTKQIRPPEKSSRHEMIELEVDEIDDSEEDDEQVDYFSPDIEEPDYF